MQELKKEFQKTVARIRAERNAEQQRKCEYPKAMMTGQQQAKGTATINCSGSSDLAAEVINHPAIVAFCAKWNATATAEAVNYGGYIQHQVRLHFHKAADTPNNDIIKCESCKYCQYPRTADDNWGNCKCKAMQRKTITVSVSSGQVPSWCPLSGGSNNG